MPIGNITSSLFTGVSGLQETQALLNTTSRNIVNAQTPGYVVKTEQGVSNAATGGVLAGPIVRFINASLQQKARTNDSDTAFSQARATALTQMDQLAGNPANGTSLTSQINTLQTDFQELAANPQAAGTQQQVLDQAQTVAQTLNSQTNTLLGLQQTASQNITADVATVNQDLQSIASLNQQVVSAEANGGDATDLEDQRDDAVNNLSSLIGVNAFVDNQGVLQVLSSDYKPLAGLYAETVTYNQVSNTVSVSGQQINNPNGDIGGNLQVLTGDTTQMLQNLSEVATKLTLGFQGLPTSALQLNGQLAAVAGATAVIPLAPAATTTLITNNGNQYTATLAYQATAGSSVYQLVATAMTPVGTAPALAAIPPNLVLGTVDMSTNPPTFAGQQVQLTPNPATPNAQPGTIAALTGFTSGLIAGAGTPTQIFSNNAMTLYTTMSGGLPPAAGPFTPPYYSGTIELNPDLNSTNLLVGDQQLTNPAAPPPQIANPAQPFQANAGTFAGAAMAAATMLNNFNFAFTTTGIAGTQTLEQASGAITVGVGQNLANTNNSITSLTTAATQIQQAIAPQSEVNLDQQMAQLVVLQNAYSSNARVVTTVNSMLDTLVNLIP